MKTYFSIAVSFNPPNVPYLMAKFHQIDVEYFASRYSYLWEGDSGAGGLAIGRQNGNGRSGSHLDELMTCVVVVVGCRKGVDVLRT